MVQRDAGGKVGEGLDREVKIACRHSPCGPIKPVVETGTNVLLANRS
jgi:hypothetical protein